MIKASNKTKYIFLLFLLFFINNQNVYALPLFAKQQNLPCAVCHTSPPSLTRFGQLYLDNGYKLSDSDQPAYKRFELANDHPDYHLPLSASIIANISVDDANNSTEKLMGMLWSAGTVTPELSVFARIGAGTQSGSSQNLSEFETVDEKKTNGAFATGPKIFAQYIYEKNHKLRAGAISPISRLSNISRNNDFRAGAGNIFSGPLQQTRIRTLRGVEYRHIKDEITLLLATGSPFSPGTSSTGQITEKGKANSEFDMGIRYQLPSLQISLISNTLTLNTTDPQDNRKTILLPIEYTHNNWIIAPTLVYSKSDTDTNQGWVLDLQYRLGTKGLITSSIQTNLKTSTAISSQATTLSYQHAFSDYVRVNISITDSNLDPVITTIGLKHLF